MIRPGLIGGNVHYANTPVAHLERIQRIVLTVRNIKGIALVVAGGNNHALVPWIVRIGICPVDQQLLILGASSARCNFIAGQHQVVVVRILRIVNRKLANVDIFGLVKSTNPDKELGIPAVILKQHGVADLLILGIYDLTALLNIMGRKDAHPHRHTCRCVAAIAPSFAYPHNGGVLAGSVLDYRKIRDPISGRIVGVLFVVAMVLVLANVALAALHDHIGVFSAVFIVLGQAGEIHAPRRGLLVGEGSSVIKGNLGRFVLRSASQGELMQDITVPCKRDADWFGIVTKVARVLRIFACTLVPPVLFRTGGGLVYVLIYQHALFFVVVALESKRNMFTRRIGNGRHYRKHARHKALTGCIIDVLGKEAERIWLFDVGLIPAVDPFLAVRIETGYLRTHRLCKVFRSPTGDHLVLILKRNIITVREAIREFIGFPRIGVGNRVSVAVCHPIA